MQKKQPSLRTFQKVFFLSLLLLLFRGEVSLAKTPDQAEFKAGTALGNDIAEWLAGLRPLPQSLGIFSVFANEPFEADYAALIEAEITKRLNQKSVFQHVSSCSECRSPQINIEGELLVVRKGMPDPESLKKISETHPVEAFLTVDVYRTSYYVTAQATVFRVPSGEMIASERFSAPALSITQNDSQFLVTFGGGRSFGGSGSSTTSLPLAVNLQLLEELGFGKGGLTLGSIFGMANGFDVYINPTISLGGNFGGSGLAYSVNFGAGFGIYGGEKGISLRGAMEFYLGKFAVAGFEVSYLIPQSSTSTLESGFYGVHIGISFGR